MTRELFFIGVMLFMCSLPRHANGRYQQEPPDKSLKALAYVNNNTVQLMHINYLKNYGILKLNINNEWFVVCDDMALHQNKASFQHAAKVACIQLGFKDGRFLLESQTQNDIPVISLDIQCHGNETTLSECNILKRPACHSNNHIVAYCSNSTMVTKAKMDLKIVENQTFGTLEANLYGFYGPICASHWTNVEANASCRHLRYTGGLAYYGKNHSDQPMVLGQFNCSGPNRTFNECSYKGITEYLGCQNKVSAAGVLCFNHEDGVRFGLTDRWHGSIRVQYEGKLGRICNTTWTNMDARVMCRQLGYKDGKMLISNKTSQDYVYMDNVNCVGTESSILECSHVGYWRPENKTCFDAAVMCDITICGSMDIRNEVDNLARLTNCTIIEGSLSILLIESTKPEEYLRYTFPNLVEITEYLLLFRADGLRSLRNLFPNLAVIRGSQLFHNYALVAFEMEDLSEIGLASLVTIPRGAVRLEKNPKLCYIHTVDWTKITNVSKTDNYFKGNKGIGECVDRCPSGCTNCWTINDCQRNLACGSKMCPSGICDRNHCCDSNCIGGCTGESSNQCTACRDVVERSNGVSTCRQKCHSGNYEYLKHRCLFDKECLNFTDYRIVSQKTMKQMSLKLVIDHGICSVDCPSGYNVDSTNSSLCVKCQGRCPKVCPAMVIDSVNAVQTIGDCNIIDGPLIIKLMGGNQIGQEFEKNFAQIDEVTHYIKISSSSPLVSLHFLKGLKVIGGKNLEQNKYALYVFDNVNLEELFLDNVASNLSIKNGTVFFQSNPKLCYKKISEFVEAIKMNIRTMSREDISKDTNGHQTPCLTQELIYSVVNVSPHIAFLSWLKINITDQRQLIGYVMHWKVAPDRNVSIYKGRDACSTDQWFSKEIDNEASNSSVIRNYIVELEAYTQYATYVEARMTSTAVENAVSKVIYFRTAAEVPSNPTNLKVVAEEPGELHVKWDEPKKPNGNVTHYEVYWQHRNLDPHEYELRNYCSSPLTSSSQKVEDVEVKINITMNDTCCPQYCPKSEKKTREEERERNLDIAFQDYLQNKVYIKRLDQGVTTMTTKISTRNTQKQNLISPVPGIFKYSVTTPTSVGSTTPSFGSSKGASNWTYTTNWTTEATSALSIKTQSDNPYMMSDVYETNEFIISNLGHFEDYNIEVIACHSRPDDIMKEMLCSIQALAYGRTLPSPTADNLNSSLIHVEQIKNNTRAFYITWKDPPHPNGLILTYEIEFRKDNIERTKPNLLCIPYKMYRDEFKYGYILDKLDPGKYLIRIRATSLAGNGSWTDDVAITVPNTGETATVIITVVVVAGIVVILVILVPVLVYIYIKRKFKKEQDAIISHNPEYVPDYFDAYEPDEWEVDRDNVQLLEELGQGSFGMVYKGLVKNLSDDGQPIKVAVKTTNAKSNDHDRYMFLQEASIMKQFKCYHVVRLIGVVSKEQPAYVLMELMPLGDLKNFLRLHRPDEEDNNGRSPPSLHQILLMAGEIADGMAYLADKKYVHRDLAARNCMVGEDMTVKIGDFGMTRDIYETDYYRKGSRGLLPVRWMAPESLKDGVFTSMTDVWSYGVVLWEMATLAAQPYQGLSNEEVLRYVGSGEIMDKPEGCPQRLYTLMIKCWKYRPQQRLTFKGIIQNLIPNLDNHFHEVSYFFSQENVRSDENQDSDDDNDNIQDGAHDPMLGNQLRNNNQCVELVDIFNDSGMYPSYNNSHRQHVGSAEFSDGTASQDLDGGACASAQSMDFRRNTECSSPNSAMGGSSDGSKDSKASSNSYAHINGLSVGNGHVSGHFQTSC